MKKRTLLFIFSFVCMGLVGGTLLGEGVFEEIGKANVIVVLGHWGPDGDCVGSTAAIQFVLQDLDKKVTVVYPNKPALNFDFAWQPENVVYGKYEGEKPDLIISCDASKWAQIVWSEELFEKVPFIVIDHHPRRDTEDELCGDYSFIDQKASSACEVLYNLFQDLNIRITPKIANALLFGIYSDTNQMKFLSRDAKQAEKTKVTVQALKDEFAADHEAVSEVFAKEETKVVGIVEDWFAANGSKELGCGSTTVEYWVIEKYVPIKAVLSIVRNIAFQTRDSEIRVIVYENVELGGLQVFLRRAQSSNFDLGALSQNVGQKLNVRGGGQSFAAGVQAVGVWDPAVVLDEVKAGIDS